MPSPSDERVVRQLAAALLFERIVAARSEPADVGGGLTRHTWSGGGRRFRCLAGEGPFGRLRIAEGAVETLEPAGWAPATLDALVDAIPAEDAEREALRGELRQTAALCAWNARNVARRMRRGLSFAELESRLDEGHPYHPCFKTRTGFTEADHAAYGPEAGATFRLVWLAVARDRLRQALPEDEAAFLARELGFEAARELTRRRDALGLDAASHGLIPVHPWQWARLKAGECAGLVDSGAIHDLGEAGDRYRATQSVRTLTNVDHPARANVKLSLDMGATSALRTIEPHSVEAAPLLSDWLAGIVADDPALANDSRLSILREYAGMVVDRDGPLGGRLAALWRESPAAALAPGEQATPFNALAAREPNGEPFVAAWLGRHSATRWVERLIEVAVVPVWRLLTAHGIATESHGQNMILVHRDGWPERVILRDFHDCVEYVDGFLSRPAPDFAAVDPAYADAPLNRFFPMDRLEELRALVMDALLAFNLTDLSAQLEAGAGFPEAEFWRRLAARLLAHDVAHGLLDRRAALGLDAPEVAVERLLARKLGGPTAALLAPNPLAAHAASLSEAS
ncbi:IucA/IucC family protein [Methylopila musalis]|uniref:IucA/IucC family protein n=1 Tax=Methylopila musalis TaxID=1134781 RepID=A0ABW3Z5R2_9HYPH